MRQSARCAASSGARARTPSSPSTAPASTRSTCSQVRELVPQLGDLARVQRGGGDDDLGRAEREPLPQRLGPERREERAEDGAELERPEHRDVELRHPAAAGEDPLAGLHAQVGEDGGEAARIGRQVRIAEVAPRALAAAPADGAALAAAGGDVPVHRLVGDVQPLSAGQAVQRLARSGPREARPRALIVGHVGRHRREAGVLMDATDAGCARSRHADEPTVRLRVRAGIGGLPRSLAGFHRGAAFHGATPGRSLMTRARARVTLA